ncbi:MAG: chaperone NapD [Pseudomonadota bacterium]
MNICGVLVHAIPARVPEVVASLSRLEGVEVHETADGGRVVVTVEDTDHALAIDTLAAIHRLDGIVAAALVYHHCEPAEPAGPLA